MLLGVKISAGDTESNKTQPLLSKIIVSGEKERQVNQDLEDDTHSAWQDKEGTSTGQRPGGQGHLSGGGRRHGEGRTEAAGRGREGAEEMAFAEAEKVTVSGTGCRVANVNTDIGGVALGLGRQGGQPCRPNAGSPVAPER